MVGCCVVQVAEGFLALPPTSSASYFAGYNAAGSHTCVRDWPAGQRVWLGTAVGAGSFPSAFFGKLNSSLIAETIVVPTDAGVPTCTQGEDSWALFTKTGPTPTPPGPTPPTPTPPTPPTCAGALAANRTNCGMGKSEQECLEAQCCFDPVIPGTFTCFRPDSKCIVAADAREVCGGATLSKTTCEEAGCCFDSTTAGTFFCFQPGAAPRPQ
jgi:hypothetical protein